MRDIVGGGPCRWLPHILEEPPEDTGPTGRFDVNTGTYEEIENE